MESGHPEEHTREKITVMETAAFVEKRLLELTICGGIAEHSTNPRPLVISNSRKSNTKSTTSQSAFGTQELSRQTGPHCLNQSI
eukprot:12926261-Heterocapsa_arctica.AAC.1